MVAKILNYKPIQITLSTLIVLGTLICIFTPNYYLFKAGANFAAHIMIGYLLLAIVFLVFRQTRLMFTSFACCAGLCMFLKHSSNTAITLAPQTNEQTIKVAHFNVTASDEDYDKTIQRIIATDADLISIQELTPDWDSVFNESALMMSTYPHSESIVRFDIFGVGVYSKYPFLQLDTLIYKDVPNLVGTIKTRGNGESVHFISAHTTPPLFSSAYDDMKNQLQLLGGYAKKINLPIITLGDFHAPPWWGEIQELKAIAKLRDSRRSATLGFSDVFQNPVDYIFYSSDYLTCIEFRTVQSNANRLGIQGIYQFQPKSKTKYATKADQ